MEMLSEYINKLQSMINEHGDMPIMSIKEAYYNDEEGYYYEDRYNSCGLYVGYPQQVYLHDGEYFTDLPYEEQKTNRLWVYIADTE